VWVTGGSFKAELASWLLIVGVFLAVMGTRSGGGSALAALAIVAESRPLSAQTQAGQNTDAANPDDRPQVTRGMRKEAVHHAWGAPEEVRKIRTCFGWQEEWVYRGDPQRFGANERVLLFDEGEVLTEIK
jgi:hypothetical protein